MIYVLMPGEVSSHLENMVKAATKDLAFTIIKSKDQVPNLQNKKLLFAIELGSLGFNIPLLEILSDLTQMGEDSLKGSTGAVLIHSDTDLYTKSTAAHIIFMANQLGCGFIGHPLVEAIADLKNFRTWQKTLDSSLEEISMELSSQLGQRLHNYVPVSLSNPKIVALHSSSRTTSNTLTLWNMITEGINSCQVEELYIKNGSVFDCYGCSFKTCSKFAEKSSCFYGGVMTETVLPTVEDADVVVWICPNYNDSISSNLMAVINRLTSLYKVMRFYDKTIFAVIVSGNSGSDSIARQLVDALNINKGFYLPPYFCIMEIANELGAILSIDGIEGKAKAFGEHISRSLNGY